MSETRSDEQRRRSAQSIRSKRMPPPPPQGPLESPPVSARQSRTSHACDRCRLMRTKCSGGVRCTKCIKDDKTCVYGDGKREKVKKVLEQSGQRIGSLEEQVTELLDALRNVSSAPGFREEDNPNLAEILHRYSAHARDNSPRSSGLFSSGISDGAAQAAGGEEHASADVGSPGHQDQLTEAVDLGRGTGAAGFMGKMSEVSWIQRAKEHLIHVPASGREDATSETLQILYDEHTREARQVNYYMDDVDLLSIDEDHVIAQEVPPLQVSFLLAEACFHATQGAFMFVNRERFLEALAHFPREKLLLSWVERRWLALANLVFALGAKWLQQTETSEEGFVHNHLEFYARARALGLDHRIVFDHPVLEQVQALGLLSFYLFVNGSIFRSWTILGHAIRHATALGLHLRVSDGTINDTDRIRRARTWFSLYSLEILVSETTGRPKSIAIADITAPIKILEWTPTSTAFSERISLHYGAEAESRKLFSIFLQNRRPGSSAMAAGATLMRSLAGAGSGVSSTHFTLRIRLCFISHRVGTALYSAGEAQSWADVQHKTTRLESDLTNWLKSLPGAFSMHAIQSAQSDPRAALELAMYYNSVRMILHRPCLCNIDIDNESSRSKDFNVESARQCVYSAMAMLDLMPEDLTSQEALQLLPWWAFLHYICQAAAVLLLELCLGAVHFPGEVARIVTYLKKVMLHLWGMTSTSRSAFKAWHIFRQLLGDATAPFVDIDISDVPEEAPQPTNWSPKAASLRSGSLVAAGMSGDTSPTDLQSIFGPH